MRSALWLMIISPLLLSGTTSCNSPINDFSRERKKAVEQFVEHLKHNDQKGVYEMTYHGDRPDNITNEAVRKRDVQRASELIHRYGLPPRYQWRYTVDLNNKVAPYSVTIPLLEKRNTEQARIYIAFPPPAVSNKICRYTVTAPNADPIENERPV